jgi:hypothetical protein
MSKPEARSTDPSQTGTRSANGRFDIATIAATFPPSADTLLVDEYMTNRSEASSRVDCGPRLRLRGRRRPETALKPSNNSRMEQRERTHLQKRSGAACPGTLRECGTSKP